MCIAYLSLGDPAWPLLIAANRDEFHNRPTQAAGPWAESPTLIAGRDLQGNGTWMAVTRTGRCALLTNYREPGHPIPPGAPSRGLLVRDFLLSPEDPAEWMARTAARSDDWAGFNLIAGDRHQTWYLGNRAAARPPRPLAAARYVLSNHLLHTPWPNADRSRCAHDALPPPLWAAAPDQVFVRLRDTTLADDARLPATGLPLDRERLLSSPFIISPDYGTRCSSVLAMDAAGRILFSEQAYDMQGRAGDRHDWRL